MIKTYSASGFVLLVALGCSDGSGPGELRNRDAQIDDDRPPTTASEATGASLANRSTESGEDPVSQLARHVALALGETGIRNDLIARMAASPFRESKLPLSLLADDDAIAGLRGWMSDLGIDGIGHELPEFEIYIPVASQREQPTDEIVVVGTSLTDSEVRARGITELPGYDTRGGVVMVSMYEVPTQTLISIVPAEQGFGAASGPMPALCDPNGEPGEPGSCDTGGGGGSGGGGGTPPGRYIYAIRMVYAPWSYDAIPFGKPEFEVWMAKWNPTTEIYSVPVDASGAVPCAGEEQPTGSARYFNYDDPPNGFTNTFLVASGGATTLNNRYGSSGSAGGNLVIVENDVGGACGNGATTPDAAEFGLGGALPDDDIIRILLLPALSQGTWSWVNQFNNDPAAVYMSIY